MHFSKFILVLLIICCSESSCDECVMIVNLSDCGVAGEALSGPRQELALYKKNKKQKVTNTMKRSSELLKKW